MDPYLGRFFQDLRMEVASRGGLDLDSVAFRDLEQTQGTDWARTLADALATCSVLVPVYSPSYFKSTTCGREWSAFSKRVEAHYRSTGRMPKSIVPVWWVPPPGEDLPTAVQRLGDTRDQFGRDHRDHGLRYLMQLKDRVSNYHEALVALAESIVAAGADPPEPGDIPDLEAEPDAFARSHPNGGGTAQQASVRGSGPRFVTFVIAAAGKQEMQAIRAMLDVYGDDYLDWRPYYPPRHEPVAARAQYEAARQNMVSHEPAAAGPSLFELLSTARKQRELVVVIVDPWAVALPYYDELLTKLDEIRSDNTAILVPWEGAAAYESSDGQRARDRLYKCLGGWIDAGAPAFRQDIISFDDFERVLGEVLVAIRAQVIKRAAVFLKFGESGPTALPKLNAPGSW